jgi:hypothetical protein
MPSSHILFYFQKNPKNSKGKTKKKKKNAKVGGGWPPRLA